MVVLSGNAIGLESNYRSRHTKFTAGYSTMSAWRSFHHASTIEGVGDDYETGFSNYTYFARRYCNAYPRLPIFLVIGFWVVGISLVIAFTLANIGST